MKRSNYLKGCTCIDMSKPVPFVPWNFGEKKGGKKSNPETSAQRAIKLAYKKTPEYRNRKKVKREAQA